MSCNFHQGNVVRHWETRSFHFAQKETDLTKIFWIVPILIERVKKSFTHREANSPRSIIDKSWEVSPPSRYSSLYEFVKIFIIQAS